MGLGLLAGGLQYSGCFPEAAIADFLSRVS